MNPQSIFARRLPEIRRVHFACDGSIELVYLVPPDFIRDGDTAIADDPVNENRCLWKVVARADGTFAWECVEPWTKARSSEYIKSCDMMCVVPIGAEP